MTAMSVGQKLLNTVSNKNLGKYPNPGMSMRFSVSIEDPKKSLDLGLWQSCKNLQMDLQYKKFAQGGGDLVDRWLPERITYSPVTLERSIEEDSSKRIKEWLQYYIREWKQYPDRPDGKPPYATAIITLHDYQFNEVMTWKLDQARPIKWIGPSLSATDNKVAIETLVIDHSGFLTGMINDDLNRAKLSIKGEYENINKGEVKFTFNPKALTVTHNSKTRNSSITGTQIVSSMTDLGLPSLSMPSVIFDGPKTLEYCERLLDWSYPKKLPGSNKSDQAVLPNLIFTWGEFRVRSSQNQVAVTLTKVDITYERFDENAKPTRASVSLDLEPIDPEVQEQQNPTSGGLPGRGGRLMAAGDTLQGIALDTYGNPADWRPLAAANQIDDPLRMRPGAALYLPAHSEFPDPGAA